MAKKITKLSTPLFPRGLEETSSTDLDEQTPVKLGDHSKKQVRTWKRWSLMVLLLEHGVIKSYTSKASINRLTQKEVIAVLHSKRADKVRTQIKKQWSAWFPTEEFSDYTPTEDKKSKKSKKSNEINEDILESMSVKERLALAEKLANILKA